MIETNDTGQKQMDELVRNVSSPEFNEWEQRFIRDISKLKYDKLSKHQKAVVTRLYGWLQGG